MTLATLGYIFVVTVRANGSMPKTFGVYDTRQLAEERIRAHERAGYHFDEVQIEEEILWTELPEDECPSITDQEDSE